MDATLVEVMDTAEDFLLIGDSSSNRFPGMSYHCYSQMNRSFHCLDIGGLKSSRGFTAGGPVISSLEELPESWSGDLAIVWVTPLLAAECTRLAASAGCTRIWYSFQTVTEEALELAASLGMEVVEAGRCPVYFLAGPKPLPCRIHGAVVGLAGALKLPPQRHAGPGRRELL